MRKTKKQILLIKAASDALSLAIDATPTGTIRDTLCDASILVMKARHLAGQFPRSIGPMDTKPPYETTT
jgi:hypothetical protein